MANVNSPPGSSRASGSRSPLRSLLVVLVVLIFLALILFFGSQVALGTNASLSVQPVAILVVLVVLAILILWLALLNRGTANTGGATTQGSGQQPPRPALTPMELGLVPQEVTLLVAQPAGVAGGNASVTRDLQTLPIFSQQATGVPADLQRSYRQVGAALGASPRISLLSDVGAERLSLVVAHVDQMTADQLTALTQDLSARAAAPQDHPEIQSTTIAIRGSAPNWVATGASQPDVMGGPAGMPTLPATPPASASDWDFALPPMLESIRAQLKQLQAMGSAAPAIDVCVLDTAPCDTDCAMATELWPGNSELQALLQPGGPLQIYHSGQTHLLDLIDDRGEGYLMSNHGLFIANIVRTIAPNARIHLIEVLNPYGVGCLESFLKGFATAKQILRGSQSAGNLTVKRAADLPGIINCSFVIPGPAIHARLKGQNQNDTPYDAGLSQMISYLTDDDRFAFIVAAAGNDGKTEPFPAKFSDAISVGAIQPTDSANTAAWYSDYDPKDPGNDVYTLGGTLDVIGESFYSNPNAGILGLFIASKLGGPEPRATNTSGWVRWSGTSFAAPIVSGVMALALSAISAPAIAQAAHSAEMALLATGGASTAELRNRARQALHLAVVQHDLLQPFQAGRGLTPITLKDKAILKVAQGTNKVQ